MDLKRNIYIILLTAVFSFIGLPSCVNDEVLDPEGPEQVHPDEAYNLTFNINLQSLQTRDGTSLGEDNFEEYEDYIDVNKFHILFFTAQNKLIKKFSSSDLTLLPVRSEFENNSKTWAVRIPISKLENGEAFAQRLRDEPFKIAVLANWNEDESQKININNDEDIDWLHHQTIVGSDPYSNTDERKETYNFLYKDWSRNGSSYSMGYYTDWAKSNNEEIKNDATTWIRNHWNPAIEKNHTNGPEYQYKTYSDLWFLWNFGGAIQDNALPYSTFGAAWEARNGENLRQWITDHIDAVFISDLDRTSREGTDRNYLGFKTINEGNKIAKAVQIKTPSGDKYYYGVQLPAITPKGDGNRINPDNTEDKEDKGYFTFTARATGTLFITGKNNCERSENSDGKIIAQIGNSTSTQSFNFKKEEEETGNKIYTIKKKISITGDEQDIYIYNGSSPNNDGVANSVDIYQIEFIQDEYLYGTDRSGVKPDSDHPIEMYGIQEFGRLKDHWVRGTTFDLSNYNEMNISNYEHHTIPLIRSVAKIELKIPSTINPSYVYLRSVNRMARWEPLDVKKNTKDIWKDFNGNSTTHPNDCEWFSIKNNKLFYDPSSSSATQANDYKEKLAWYYGNWSTDGQKVGGITINKTNGENYPNIMNALISRSDFVEFIPAGTEGIYKRYVLYVGEKYVDDPNDVGPTENMITSDPKICHIEFRVGDNVSHTNLDDNNSVRIYFIENGVKEGYTVPQKWTEGDKRTNSRGETVDNDWEHTYEQEPSLLENHWPIMRNHVYSFTVQDVDHLAAIVTLNVLPWKIVDGNNSYDW